MKKALGKDIENRRIINLLDYLKRTNPDLEAVVRDLEEETRALAVSLNINLAISHHPVSAKVVEADCYPPRLAEFLLTVLATSRRTEAMIGDLNEYFTRECEEFGRDRAVRLYWARALRSLGPLLRRAAGKVLKWGAVIAAARRLF
jgi:hypothetical protein